MGVVSGGAHIFGHEIRTILKAFAEGDHDKAKELFVPLYRFCKACGQNGRILPNSIMRPAIEMVTGIPIGPCRGLWRLLLRRREKFWWTLWVPLELK